MDALTHFLAMGGYGRFIWTAYGVTALVLSLLIWDTLARAKRRRAELAALERVEGPGIISGTIESMTLPLRRGDGSN